MNFKKKKKNPKLLTQQREKKFEDSVKSFNRIFDNHIYKYIYIIFTLDSAIAFIE